MGAAITGQSAIGQPAAGQSETVQMESSKSSERDRQLRQILLEAVDQPLEQRRDAMLALGYAADLVDEALELLAEEDRQFLAGPVKLNLPEGDLLPEIPGYQLKRLIGEGGMGRVFEAEETADTRRQVAIKMVRSYFAGAQLFERFATERRAMARLNHPAIAQLYAADTTPAGEPYVVMEYVDGQPLLAYCDAKRLGIEQRLELFLAICRGVEHAHRRFLLHRDLKPSNILVFESDGGPWPKIIDFGIAKELDGTLHGAQGAVTATGASAPGTPAYMSPEALRPESGQRDIDIRSDVYSLGVVLYELLVGSRPQIEATDDPLLPSRILEDDPERPSSRWRSMDEGTRARVAATRGLEQTQVVATLSDLDWILMKAIARDRDRRYDSVGELAADVGRYLRHEPVEARPPSLSYRLSCFAKRHRMAALAAGLGLLALLLGTFAATLGMVRAQAAEAEARAEALRASQEAQTATRVTDLLVGLFSVADPNKGGSSTTMELGELLSRGSASIEQQLDEEPAIQARLKSVLGDIFRVVGDYERSRHHLERSLELMQSEPEPDAYRLGQTLNHLAVLDRQEAHFEDALSRLEHASTLWTEALGPEHSEVAGLLNNRGNVLMELGRYEEAAEALESALEKWQRSLGPNHRSVGIAALNLGNVWNLLGRAEQSLGAYRRAGRIFEGIVGADHPHMAVVKANIARALSELGRFEEAEQAIQQAVDIRLENFGEEHDHTLRIQHAFARILLDQKKFKQAEEILVGVFEKHEALLGPNHPQIAYELTDLSRLRREQGRFDEAEALAERSVGILEGQITDDAVNLGLAREALVAARSELKP